MEGTFLIEPIALCSSVAPSLAAAMAQLVRAFASHAEGWIEFESRPRQTQVVKTNPVLTVPLLNVWQQV